MSTSVNIARRLGRWAAECPERRAIVSPLGRDSRGRRQYREISFGQLEAETNRLAAGYLHRGLRAGQRIVLFVPFGIDFIVQTFALLKTGAVLVLIDPGMGRQSIFNCLAEVEPDGFIAVRRAHLIRSLMFWKFPRARFNVCVDGWFPGVLPRESPTTENPATAAPPLVSDARDPAAVIFTSGSTGPPKGVLYEHGMFDAQVDLIQEFYGIQPGEVDLPGFPLFGLFNAAMGVTTVIPDMDPTRPADVNPELIVEAIRDQQVTQAFGSPAFWNRVGRYGAEQNAILPTLKRALSAGGPAPLRVLEQMQRMLVAKGADLHTPYGATESLPVSSISASEILEKTAAKTRRGGGACVGRRFPRMQVKVIRMTEGPIAAIGDAEELSPGEIGEILVSGPSVTREYFRRPEQTRMAKVADGDRCWHRIGDVGYLDEEGLLWFCGRKAHVVRCGGQTLFSICCEAIYNEHQGVERSALVGVGQTPEQRPVLVVEPRIGCYPETAAAREAFSRELLERGRMHAHTAAIETFLYHPSLPVDTRHNVKINREALAEWAASQLTR